MTVNAVSAAQASPTTVAPHKTSVSPDDVRAALERAYRKTTGKAPTEGTLDILTAHVSHETARGAKMYNYNFGGIKGAGPSGLEARCRTTEYLPAGGGRTRAVRVSDHFRAYQDIDEGAQDYLRFLGGRYQGALDAAERGDVTEFARALKEKGYFTAPLEDYASSLRGLAALHGGAAGNALSDLPTLPGPGGGARGIGLRAEHGTRARGPQLLEPGAADLRELPTEVLVARMLDVVGASSARLAAPARDASGASHEGGEMSDEFSWPSRATAK